MNLITCRSQRPLLKNEKHVCCIITVSFILFTAILRRQCNSEQDRDQPGLKT